MRCYCGAPLLESPLLLLESESLPPDVLSLELLLSSPVLDSPSVVPPSLLDSAVPCPSSLVDQSPPHDGPA